MFCIFEYGQCPAFGSQLVETLIFQGEFEEDVTCRKPNQESKEANAWSKHSRRQKHRHQLETARATEQEDQQGPHPFDQKHLKPRISIFVVQQHANRFGEGDQIAERAVFVGEDEYSVRHNSERLRKRFKAKD
jgi:hypothetical protein